MLPQAFIDNMRAQFPDEAEALFEALDQPYAAALRLNTLRGDVDALSEIAAPFADGTVPPESASARPEKNIAILPPQSSTGCSVKKAGQQET